MRIGGVLDEGTCLARGFYLLAGNGCWMDCFALSWRIVTGLVKFRIVTGLWGFIICGLGGIVTGLVGICGLGGMTPPVRVWI